jgi:putative Mg2+ transporter-C (MgtC) family protein
MFGFDIDLDLMQYHFFQLGIAFILSLPIALNREMKDNGAGLRTFPLVTIASCAFMLVGRDIYESAGEARIMYAIITGMGFIGGGAIFKNEMGSKGTATAASLWNTGAIGISVAYGRYEIAIILSAVGFLILQFSEPFKKVGRDKDNNNN